MIQNEAAFPQKRSLRFDAAGLTATGHNIFHNADAFALYDGSRGTQEEQLGQIYLLADGRGDGYTGAIVSRMAIDAITESYYAQSDALRPLGRLQRAFLAAHERFRAYVKEQGQSAERTMTTCTAVVVNGNRGWVAHLGDSRAYLVHIHPERTIARLTTDHSLRAAQMRSAPGCTNEPTDHSDILLRALGIADHRIFQPDFAIVTFRAGDVLLLCSDGLWQAITEECLVQMVSEHTPQDACSLLVHQASRAEMRENVSVVILAFSPADVPDHMNVFPLNNNIVYP